MAVNPLNTKQKVLTFGGGGGFTGVSTTYYLLEDGTLFRNGLTDTTFYLEGKLPADVVQQQFVNYHQLGIDKLNFDEPGNKYFYLEMRNKNERHKVQWGGQNLEDNGPKLLYSLLMKIVKQNNSKKQ